MLVLGCIAVAAGLHHQLRAGAPRMDATAWSASEVDEMCLLPFGLEEALLPGETKQVHLYEARFLQLFEEAESKHASCVGQLLITPSGNVAAVTSLLEIEESRKQDVGVWAKLRCVGRIRLAEVDQTEFGFVRASVSLVTDDPLEGEDMGKAVGECLEAHAACHELQTKLDQRANGEASDSEGATSSEGDDERARLESLLNSIDSASASAVSSSGMPSSGGRVEWGHEVTQGSLGFVTALPRVLAARREMLCFRGLDEAPASSLDEHMQRLWGVQTESDAEDQLLSFAASACLSVKERAMALMETNTLERVQAATASFRESQRRLAAQVALADAAGDASL